MIGPVFAREATSAPKRTRTYIGRGVYLLAFLLLLCTGYLVLAETRGLTTTSQSARFGTWMFMLLAPLQLLVLSFNAAVGATSSVALEKDRRTLILMLMTRLTGAEVVVGKLGASLLGVLSLLACTAPLFLALTLFGGVSLTQVARVYLITVSTVFTAASIGTVVALWREKTFQSIAVTVLTILLWLVLCEVAIVAGAAPNFVALISPPRALAAASSPLVSGGVWIWYSVLVFAIGIAITLLGIAKVRIWNPSREVRMRPPEPETGEEAAQAEAGDQHTDTTNWKVRKPRAVWDNPILWREVCTWAYGRKVLLIRLAYLLVFAVIATSIYFQVQSGEAFERTGVGGRAMPSATLPVAILGVISLVMINALSVNSVTGERDGLALDLLMVTDLRPQEFVLGKLLGVLYVTKEMVLLPIALLVAMTVWQVINVEDLVYSILGWLVLSIFVTMLGIHCGLNYPLSRSATLVSLGTVFFLCVGIAVCMVIMVSFRGAFEIQLAPFAVMILGGSAALFAALGWQNPSRAIFVATAGLPLLTFFAITQFLLQRDNLYVIFAITLVYGFAVAAMYIPAISEFNVALEKNRSGPEDG